MTVPVRAVVVLTIFNKDVRIQATLGGTVGEHGSARQYARGTGERKRVVVDCGKDLNLSTRQLVLLLDKTYKSILNSE